MDADEGISIMSDNELFSLKEAIIDLYLAIKIRSAEEVFSQILIIQLEKVDKKSIEKEKYKLMQNDGFVVLEYIRASIEIIMSLKIEELDSSHSKK